MLTVERIKELYHYDPETGLFMAISNRAHVVAGSVHSSKDRHGYVRFHIDGKKYQAHRVAWLYSYGEFPAGIVDHINCVRDDNRLSNLRIVSRSLNTFNTVRRKLGKVKGASFDPRIQKWNARMKWNGQAQHLGSFATYEEARAAYENAIKQRELC